MCIIFTVNIQKSAKPYKKAGEDERLCQCWILECEHMAVSWFYITITYEKTLNSSFKLSSVNSHLTAAGKLTFFKLN